MNHTCYHVGHESIVLVPYVYAHDGASNNSDFLPLQVPLNRFQLPAAGLTLGLCTLCVSQIEHLLVQCLDFIGARTRAKIGAMPYGVPDSSLGYSIQAPGLNRALLGDQRYGLATKDMSHESRCAAFEPLRLDEPAAGDLRASRSAQWKPRARKGVVKPRPNGDAAPSRAGVLYCR